MRNFKTVMVYTILEQVRKKTFIFSNLFMIGVLILMFNVPNILNMMQKDINNNILLVDTENIYLGMEDAFTNLELEYKFTFATKKLSDEEISTKINNDEYRAAVILSHQDGKIHFNYIVRNLSQTDMTPEILKEVLGQLYFYSQLAKLNLSEKEMAALNTEISYEAMTTSGEGQPVFSASIIILSIALFFAIYFYAFQVSSAVTTEKTSKVMETLVTSTNPKSIILGKTIGVALLGIAQFTGLVLVGIICYKIFMPETNPLVWLDFSNITAFALIVSLIYFVLGYALFAFLYALVGSTVSKPEDISTANAPVAMISLFGFYFGYFTVIFSPTSELTKIASLIPISSPFCMPFRRMVTNVPFSELMWSIIILIITIMIIINISVRIYSLAVLHYGSKLTFKDLFSLYRER